MRFLCAGKDDFIREQFFIRIFNRYRLMRIIIIGAGVAGCFAAINIKRNQPDAVVTVLESGKKPLAKVAVTGGGRCNLTNQEFRVDGKNRFKDEFVTCGCIALPNVNPSTLECRTCPGLYFAGEVLDVDAVTGGFNLQAAWTMGYVVAKNL